MELRPSSQSLHWSALRRSYMRECLRKHLDSSRQWTGGETGMKGTICWIRGPDGGQCDHHILHSTTHFTSHYKDPQMSCSCLTPCACIVRIDLNIYKSLNSTEIMSLVFAKGRDTRCLLTCAQCTVESILPQQSDPPSPRAAAGLTRSSNSYINCETQT